MSIIFSLIIIKWRRLAIVRDYSFNDAAFDGKFVKYDREHYAGNWFPDNSRLKHIRVLVFKLFNSK